MEEITQTPTPPATPDVVPRLDQDKTSSQAANATPTQPAQNNVKPAKLTGAQIKAQKQAEKAKRRAGAVALREGAATAAEQVTPVKGDGQAKAAASTAAVKGIEGGASKGKQDQLKALVEKSRRGSNLGQKPTTITAPEPPKQKDPRDDIPERYSHLPMARRMPTSEADDDVHPAILALGQQMGAFQITHNTERLEYMLHAIKQVIQDYDPPEGTAFSRHFVPHVLNKQVEYLTECRPMCFAMGNAIRLIKKRISDMDLDTTAAEAIEELCTAIDGFIRERIIYAEDIISRNAADLLVDDDVVVTYRHQKLVRKALDLALSRGLRISVTILDDSQQQDGLELASHLAKSGGMTDTIYQPSLAGIKTAVQNATYVFLGGEGIFSDGGLYGTAGTADIAGTAVECGTPVIALCETVNFARDRIATDALSYNEIDPDRYDNDAWRLLYDYTPSESLAIVVSEHEEENGQSPPQGTLCIMRRQEDPN